MEINYSEIIFNQTQPKVKTVINIIWFCGSSNEPIQDVAEVQARRQS